MTTTQITAAANGAWIASALLVAVLAVMALIHRGRSMTIEARKLCIGALIGAFGVVLHRGYWNLGIVYRTSGDDYASWASNFRALPSLAVFLIVGGMVYALYPYGKSILGSAWIPLVALTILSSVLISVILAR